MDSSERVISALFLAKRNSQNWWNGNHFGQIPPMFLGISRPSEIITNGKYAYTQTFFFQKLNGFGTHVKNKNTRIFWIICNLKIDEMAAQKAKLVKTA